MSGERVSKEHICKVIFGKHLYVYSSLYISDIYNFLWICTYIYIYIYTHTYTHICIHRHIPTCAVIEVPEVAVQVEFCCSQNWVYGELYCAVVYRYEHRNLILLYIFHALSNIQIRFIPTCCTVYTIYKLLQHICVINQRNALFNFTLWSNHTFTCFRPICSPSSRGRMYMCGKW
jgi:hypothetical protein